MKRFDGFMAGANLGHWLSQYTGGNAHGDAALLARQDEHFRTYIQESDFARMREWGLDHVRLPVDYFLFEDDEQPGVYKEARLAFVDNALESCKKYGLNLLLDLHHAPGFIFLDGLDSEKNNLFFDEGQQQRYREIWKMFANRYRSEGDNLAFELLNELAVEDVSYWNRLWQNTADAILRISPRRKIVIGSNYWNSVDHLKTLDVIESENFVYNFHAYEPMLFTHQRASWDKTTAHYPKAVTYPFERREHADWMDEHTSNRPPCFRRETMDKAFLREFLEPAAVFLRRYDVPVYCGEYGVIAHADDRSAERWLDDMTSLFSELGIGHAVWSYRGFSNITDRNNRVVSDRMVQSIARR